jgi:hypothetical protein
MTKSYEDILQLRDSLTGTMGTIADGLAALAEERGRQLRVAADTVKADAFRLLVLGEFKRGKSTLINAMLGQDVLPARVAPCTAIVTEVKYADTPRAVLHFTEKDKPPITVPPDQLRRYVVIEGDDLDDEDEAAGHISKSPYSSMELYYPLELCRNQVEIVDSPGINEHKTRTDVALDALSRTDAVILVLSCQQALSKSERSFVEEYLGGRNLRNVFVVWNHFDHIVDSPDDIQDIQKRSRTYFEPRGVPERRQVFFVTARTALVARKKQDRTEAEQAAVAKLEQFERALEQFLTTDRARAKLRRPLEMAENAVRDSLSDLIPRKESMLRQPLQELQRLYEEQRPRLEEVERQRERLLYSVQRRIDAMCREATASYMNLVASLEAGARGVVDTIDVKYWDAIKSQRKAREGVEQALSGWYSEKVKSWQEQGLSPLVDRHSRELEADIEQQAQKLVSNIDAVRAVFAPDVSMKLGGGDEDVSKANRVLSAVGGFLVGGVGSAMEGASLGYKGMAKGLALNVAVSVALIASGVGLPVVVGVLAAVGLYRTITGAKGVVQQLREKVAADFVAALRQRAPEVTQDLTSRITAEFGKLQQALDAATRIMIDEAAGQVQGVLKEKQQGEETLRQEQARLAAVREQLTGALRTLESLRAELELEA